MIVGALVGAIGLGGGLAYGYKTFLGSAAPGKTPIVKADKSPAKTQPVDAGGKTFANQGVKVMGGRLTDGGTGDDAQSGSSQGTMGDDGVRRVSTVAVRPDGSLSAPQPQPCNVLPPMANVVPGMSVVNPIRPVGPGAYPQQQASAPMQPQVGSGQPMPQQKVIILPPPRAEAPPAPPPPVTRSAAPVQPRVASATLPAEGAAPAPPKKQPVPRVAAAPAATGGSGSFVAVLASQRSQMDALKLFPDLQAKYSVLQGRTPTVQEANLGDKGIYARLVVPAGAREQASALCTELTASGHKDCWVMAQ